MFDFNGVFCACVITVFLGGLFLLRQWRDRARIHQEADSRDCRVLSITWRWWPFGHGPFSVWEWSVSGCRVYRVRCETETGDTRVGFVLIGPRRPMNWIEYSFDERFAETWHGTLTWRWQTSRRRRSRRS